MGLAPAEKLVMPGSSQPARANTATNRNAHHLRHWVQFMSSPRRTKSEARFRAALTVTRLRYPIGADKASSRSPARLVPACHVPTVWGFSPIYPRAVRLLAHPRRDNRTRSRPNWRLAAGAPERSAAHDLQPFAPTGTLPRNEHAQIVTRRHRGHGRPRRPRRSGRGVQGHRDGGTRREARGP